MSKQKNSRNESQVPEDPIERFFYWIKERYQIHYLRKAGVPKPWTTDPVLQTVFFTNPYRELDKTTIWFRENIRHPLKDDVEVLFATLAFRLFNYIPTGELLHDCANNSANSLFEKWHEATALRLLQKQQKTHGKVFTGAYIIKLYNGMPKIDAACQILSLIWKDRERLYDNLITPRIPPNSTTLKEQPVTLQYANEQIMKYPQMGPFMSYEVVCDLRYTHILKDAPDVFTWANIGPGANRGLHRLFNPSASFARGETPNFPRAVEKLQELLRIAPDYLGRFLRSPPSGFKAKAPQIWDCLAGDAVVRIPLMPRLEMREIEHSLCEFDKYERARLGDGHLKRMFAGR